MNNLAEVEVLSLLSKLGESPGLVLVKASERAGGTLRRVHIYHLLGKMEQELLLESRQENADEVRPEVGIPRRRYRLTTIGRRALERAISEHLHHDCIDGVIVRSYGCDTPGCTTTTYRNFHKQRAYPRWLLTLLVCWGPVITGLALGYLLLRYKGMLPW